MIFCFVCFLASCGKRQSGFDAMGTFEATEVTVSSEASGRIMSFDVMEGQEVTKDVSIGMIDTVQLYLSKLQLMQTESSVRSNRPDIGKQIASVKEQIAKQQTERARVENLLKAEAATQKQMDDIVSAIAVLERCRRMPCLKVSWALCSRLCRTALRALTHRVPPSSFRLRRLTTNCRNV